MLAEVVETRKLLSTMAGERTFAGVFPVDGEEVRDGVRTEGGKGQGTRT